MQFLYPALTAGFFLALLPLLIHLINMMRHQRVQWAAMEFLLQSYKKHRKWVWLRQLLLLLARMLAVLLIVAMLAQLVTRKHYEGFFGDTLTHHYILLDDSMSMTDRAGGIDAFEQALRFVAELGTEATRQEMRQRVTLVRFSRAQSALATDPEGAGVAAVADLNAQDVDSQFPLRLEKLRTTFHATELPIGPESALQIAQRLIAQQGQENRILYLVSDFRAKEWSNPREIRERLGELTKASVQVRLVNCVRAQHGNLALTRVEPAEETRAAGVPLFVNVQITNYGDEPVERVPLHVRTMAFEPPGAASEVPVAKPDETPMMEIERIEPGQSITQRVQVYFTAAGQHVVEAVLPDDAVAADNRRWCVIDFPEEESALVIDGDPAQRNAFFIQAIFQPGQRARTGVRPEIQSVAFLRDVNAESLEKYSAVYLFDVDRLDDRARDTLEAYVKAGGGLVIFVGPQVNIAAYNQQLYREGQGLFPLPLTRDDLLVAADDERVPDVEIEAPDHPVFEELTQGQNPLIRTMHVERFLRSDGNVPADVKVLARLRNRAPLVVEKPYGAGRVVVFLTTYAPYWNDMVLGPNVLLTLRLQSYLGFARRTSEDHTVQSEIQVPLNGDQFRPDVRVFLPTEDPAAPLRIARPAVQQAADSRQYVASIANQETERSGIYEMWLARIDGTLVADRFAVNVESREGDLVQSPATEIAAALDPVTVDLGYADQFESAAIEQAGFNQSVSLMVLLILLLLGEQALAYWNSFHARRSASLSHLGRPGHRASIERLRADNEADTQALQAAREAAFGRELRTASTSSSTDRLSGGPPR